jgi:hypothetical protein
MSEARESLTYVEPEHVSIDGRSALGMEVRGRTGRFLGCLDGVVFDRVSSRARYLVVRPTAESRDVTLEPIEQAHVDRYDGVIRLEADRLEAPVTHPVGRLPFPNLLECEALS